MKPSAEIPVHYLEHTNFYASYTDGINFGDFSASHRVDFFAIIWFTEDAGTHYIDFEPHEIKKNSVYLLARNQVHALPGARPQSKVIIFSKDFFDNIEEDELRFMFVPFSNEEISIPPEMQAPFAHLFELILLETQTANNYKLLHTYTSAYLQQLHRFSQNSFTRLAYQDERLRKLFNLISAHYKTHKLAAFYADKIGLSPKRLNQLVKRKIGLTVSQLIYNYLLIEARRELRHSAKSVKEIAIELGFKGQSYFSRFFKKQAGVTPESFRQVND